MDSSAFAHIFPTEKEINRGCGCFLLVLLILLIGGFVCGVFVGLMLRVL